jgi:hypothetical protein
MDFKFDHLCYVDLNISGYTFLCSFLHGDLIIGFANYNGFVRGPKTKRSCSPCRHCSIKI